MGFAGEELENLKLGDVLLKGMLYTERGHEVMSVHDDVDDTVDEGTIS